MPSHKKKHASNKKKVVTDAKDEPHQDAGAAAPVSTTTASVSVPTSTTANSPSPEPTQEGQPQQQPQQEAMLELLMQRQTLNDKDDVISSHTKNNNNQQQQQVMPIANGDIRGKYHDSVDNGNDKKQHHAFWDTQPMPHGSREGHPEGPIVPNKPVDEIRQEPYTMPTGFQWSNVDVHNEDDIQELYQLLSNNYVEDDDALFRFDYSPEFLRWALLPPGSRPDFLFGVRSVTTHKLVAFISAVPATLQVYAKIIPVVEINYLCVHKKLRSKRLAPVLIKEITRRVNITGTFQAVYTAGTVLPVPVSSARYHHRSLNPKKLVRVNFSRVGHRMTMARMLKLYKLPETTSELLGLRPMEEKDVVGVHELLTQYLQRFEMKILFTIDEIRHWLLPRAKVVDSYVITDDSGTVTDFLSFYHLPSSILHHNDKLFAAYSFYNVATTVSLAELMKNALILAKNTGSDVFNALDLMENSEFLEELKFGLGDGNLRYYIYNWACPDMLPDKVGVVLL